MAAKCPLCFTASVTHAGRICAGCTQGLPPTVRPTLRERLKTGPVQNWPKIWKRARRTYEVLLRGFETSLAPTRTEKGIEYPAAYDGKLAAAFVALTNGMERASAEERKWGLEEKEKGASLSFPEQVKTATAFLASGDVPEEDRRRAVALLLESLGESHLAPVETKESA